MKSKKLVLSLVVLLSFALLISGCGSSKTQEKAKEQSGPIELKLGHVLNEDSHFHAGALEFARLVKEKSNGRLTVSVFANGLLGNDRTLAEGMQFGTVDMAVVSSATMAGFVPRIQLFEFPFLFRDAQHAYKVLDGPIGDTILKDFEAKQIIGLAFWENGFRHLTNSKRPVKVPADVKGLKIRVQEIPLHLSFWKQLGTDPMPMAWGEVYTALQQKTVDAQENPINLIYTSKMYEVQKHLSLTGHVYAPTVTMISKKIYDKLPADLQKIIVEASKETAPYQRNVVQKQADEAIAKLPGYGVTIEANPDKEAFRKIVMPVYKEYGDKLGITDLLNQIIETK